MREIKSVGFQGDVMFRRVDKLPPDLKAEKPAKSVVVAHSETGHHHTVDGVNVALFRKDEMTCYLMLDSPAEVVHHRPFDTHETLGLGKGTWEVRRQREWAPEGWRQVQD
jgi:hypothetical protein